jgi:hypothetical protein
VRSRLAALLLLIPLTTSCATHAELELHKAQERIAELELIVAGKDDDNAMLQAFAIELQSEIMEWQRGAYMQARAMERLRSNCEQ